MSSEEDLLWMILNALPEVGPATFRCLMERFDRKICGIFSSSYEELVAINGISPVVAEHITNWEKYFNPEKEQQQLATMGAKFIPRKDERYAPLLREVSDAPIGLYFKGEINLSHEVCIAIVGTRRASTYGLRMARNFAQELAGAGFVIVSGMALGVDAAAHEGALSVAGKTVAILGSGLDIIYPREHKMLYEKIAKDGGIFSEFRLGREVDRATFPIRNRIIAGMCSHVIVIESEANGGSMITANIAREYGRTVMALPGCADQRMSQGCHALIRNGAVLVSDVSHIIEALTSQQQQLLNFKQEQELQQQKVDILSFLTDPLERKIINLLRERGSMVVDDFAMELEVPFHHFVSRLQLLELRHFIRYNMGEVYMSCPN
ncbi:MAG: DNA-processing protein DprA [Puniceicoccales bacterium]|jgi:DNA processing protein|nr:DNA-processing protein DprA [Puniceicoccales bacterium]